MKVYLAGYNVDSEILKELEKAAAWEKNNVTPESLSASYARISRDPRDIPELRADAREEIDRARKSNEKIIFGFGHQSVAEHAVFNFDVVGLSRLAVEEVQRFRLASFTEKSQRYITLDGDYYVPEEIAGTPFEKKYRDVIDFQNSAYNKLYSALREDLFKKHADMIETKTGTATVDGWAKEDARYAVSLGTLSQFGMTVNARTLEYMLRRFRGSGLQEIRDFADSVYSLTGDFCPSIIKYTRPSEGEVARKELLKSEGAKYNLSGGKKETDTLLLRADSDGDERLLAAILFSVTGASYEECRSAVEKMSYDERESLVRAALSGREFYDGAERVFEALDFEFQLTVSASNYAQLKRHRMSTQFVQDYDVSLGITVPPSIKEIAMEETLREAAERSEELYHELAEEFPGIKNYVLTNGHRRRVFCKMNLRELYHFVALREDAHAQWDIRKTAIEMRKLAEEVSPLSTMMLCGRSDFNEKKKNVFP